MAALLDESCIFAWPPENTLNAFDVLCALPFPEPIYSLTQALLPLLQSVPQKLLQCLASLLDALFTVRVPVLL